MAPRNRKIHSSSDLDSPERDTTKKSLPRICPASGKRVYSSEREAAATAAHQISNNQSAPSKLRTYKCVYCSGYHLTSKQP
jgi:hypothetical protein